MGVAGFYQHLKKCGFEGTPATPESLEKAHFELDVFGTYYSFLLSRLASPTPDDAKGVGRALGYLLSHTFDPARTTLHIDGQASTQKNKARIERNTKRTKALQALNQNLNAMTRRSAQGKWTQKSVVRQIEAGLKKV
ncbi:hypothetical protein EDD11_007975, partial [Mortierella claussenii]